MRFSVDYRIKKWHLTLLPPKWSFWGLYYLNVCLIFFFPQFCQQVSAEGWGLLRSARTVPEGYWDLRAGMRTFHLCQLWWLLFYVCFSLSYLVGSKSHTSVLHLLFWLHKCFRWEATEMWYTLQEFSVQQWGISTFNHCNIGDIVEALPQTFKVVDEIITALWLWMFLRCTDIHIFAWSTTVYNDLLTLAS